MYGLQVCSGCAAEFVAMMDLGWPAFVAAWD